MKRPRFLSKPRPFYLLDPHFNRTLHESSPKGVHFSGRDLTLSFQFVTKVSAASRSCLLFPHQVRAHSQSPIKRKTVGANTFWTRRFSICATSVQTTCHFFPLVSPNASIHPHELSHIRPARYTFVPPVNAEVPYRGTPSSSMRIFTILPTTQYVQLSTVPLLRS